MKKGSSGMVFPSESIYADAMEENHLQNYRKSTTNNQSFSLDSSFSYERRTSYTQRSSSTRESFTKIQPGTTISSSSLSAKFTSSPTKSLKELEPSSEKQSPKNIKDFEIHTSDFDSYLSSYGPYIRVYDKKQSNPSPVKSNVYSPHKSPVKYTSIIDVSSSREKLYSTTYPTVIKVPPSITRVVVGSVSPNGKSFIKPGFGPPSTITLSRPNSNKSGMKYSRSNPSSNDRLFTCSNETIDPSIPKLPFLQMTNSLQLHLKMKILDDTEQIIVWAPGSFVIQPLPFLQETQKRFAFESLFGVPKSKKDHTKAPPLHFPAYLLLTNKYVYIAKPLFRLSKLKNPVQDEQTSYLNPSKLLEIAYKFSLNEISRMDAGPGRQYLAFHVLSTSTDQKQSILSLLFQTRSRQTSTVIIDTITTLLHEDNAPSLNTNIINQDTEWCIRNIQDQILLRPGPKSTTILSYSDVWENSEKYRELQDSEFDSGIHEQITKVDFDFVRTYLFGVFLRYIRPVPEAEARGVEIVHSTIFSTREYIYMLQERLDIWPPSVFPPEYGKQFPSLCKELQPIKGYLVDKVPQFSVLGVGRIDDITRVERWRSWRIDESFGDGHSKRQFKGLGEVLQNGHIGYFETTQIPSPIQQANASGWFWWIRVHFGTITDSTLPESSPKNIPICGYWWDLMFASRESCEEFIETIKILKGNKKSDCKFVVGDD